MTYSNDDIKKYGFAVIDGTVYQHFENEGWKNVAAVMEVDRYEADSYGFPVPVMAAFRVVVIPDDTPLIVTLFDVEYIW